MRSEELTFRPVAYVSNARITKDDDHWLQFPSTIELAPDIPESSLNGIESFSHLEIIFHFNKLDRSTEIYGDRHPRDNPDFPKVGIFAQRGASRPNRIGVTIVKLLEHSGRMLKVEGLDAITGTPILDIKPVIKEFLPREMVIQPEWAGILMKDYW
jgi:tRNA (adenine37-N6)-methyltransferase